MNRSTYTQQVNYFLSADAIRKSCQRVFEHTLAGNGQFHVDLNKLPQLAEQLIAFIYTRYPNFQIPFHARLRHFRTQNQDRISKFLATLTHLSAVERSKSIIDLIVVSVLLDAGAGDQWQYRERETGEYFSRSEGLAIASFHMFQEGLFSTSYQAQVDGEALLKLPTDSLAHGLQISSSNPIIGLEARTEVLNRLGTVLTENKALFPHSRPGDFITYLHQNYGHSLSAGELLQEVLKIYNHVWPHRPALDGVPLGDCWFYPPFENLADEGEQLVVFHKLAQWLSYSLVEPIEAAGIHISHLDQMTGLAEYRNGGLFMDSSVLHLKDDSLLSQEHPLESSVIIEWRALTIILLDKLANTVREKLNLSKESLPLAKILEGGTWALGRKLAFDKRPDGSSPIRLSANGTTF